MGCCLITNYYICAQKPCHYHWLIIPVIFGTPAKNIKKTLIYIQPMITKFKVTAALVCAALLAPMAAMAIPAYPGLMKVKQADGTELTVRLRGDETHSFYLTEDDYLLEQRDGIFYYANVDATGKMVSSDFRAKEPALRNTAEREYLSTVNMPAVLNAMTREAAAARELKASIEAMATPVTSVAPKDDDYQGYGLFANASFPVKGEQKGLVVLVEYQDVKFHSGYDAGDYFTRLCNEEGFNTHGGTGSARDFFTECSGGQFDITFDVYGPVTLPENMAYYGAHGFGGNDIRPADMVIHALNILDEEVDFSQYDCDGDGNIDNVFVFYAGMGEATGGGANTVWPHQWDVTYGGHNKYYDGVKAGRYACSNEWETMYSGGPRPDGVGTFIHEFSHVMGLPDLYATDYTGAFTPGDWSCMDSGPYNNEGRTPPLYGAFERNALGWMRPEEITGPVNGTLSSIGNNEAYIINTNRPTEFFLLENRQKVSWDSYIPGEGMLIWHVFYSPSVWSSNRVNNDPNLQYVDIEEADGTQTDNSRKNDAFPGLNGKFTSFTDNTKPSMMTWQKKKVNKPITKIALNDGIITFKACGGIPDINATEALSTTDITPGGFTANWAPSDATDKEVAYLLSVYTKDNKGNRSYAPGYRKLLVDGTSCAVDNLESLTEYFWIVQVLDIEGEEESFESNELSAVTLEPTFAYVRPTVSPATNVTSNSFTANWESVEGATGYFIDVFTKTLGEVESYECGFDDFISPDYELPDGWSTNVSLSYTTASYSGKSKPAARLQKDGDYVESCECLTPIRRVSFWNRGVTKNDINYIRLWVNVSGAWQEADSIGICYDKGGEIVTIDYLPDFTQAIRLEFKRSVTGTLALDDIQLDCAADYIRTPLADFTSYYAGNSLSAEVTGLEGSTTYFYTVRATDGTLTTRTSYEAKVITMGGDNAIATVTTDEMADIRVSGRTLTAVEAVSIFDFSGRQIASLSAGRSITLAPGVYLVRGNTSVAKVAIR